MTVPEWGKFTKQGLRVMLFAQEEAVRLKNPSVETEHLLLGLLRERDSMVARILGRLGVPLWRVRFSLRRHVTTGPGITGGMEVAPGTARALVLADEEARRLSNDYIGPEHLLLGLIEEGEGLAAKLLTRLGAAPERARAVSAQIAHQGSD